MCFKLILVEATNLGGIDKKLVPIVEAISGAVHPHVRAAITVLEGHGARERRHTVVAAVGDIDVGQGAGGRPARSGGRGCGGLCVQLERIGEGSGAVGGGGLPLDLAVIRLLSHTCI